MSGGRPVTRCSHLGRQPVTDQSPRRSPHLQRLSSSPGRCDWLPVPLSPPLGSCLSLLMERAEREARERRGATPRPGQLPIPLPVQLPIPLPVTTETTTGSNTDTTGTASDTTEAATDTPGPSLDTRGLLPAYSPLPGHYGLPAAAADRLPGPHLPGKWPPNVSAALQEKAANS